jgi:hypothetical protein
MGWSYSVAVPFFGYVVKISLNNIHETESQAMNMKPVESIKPSISSKVFEKISPPFCTFDFN